MSTTEKLLAPVLDFLHGPTPDPWFAAALAQQDILLIDHANCERKAASTAMNLMYRHTAKTELMTKMSQLAREELLHFEQVVAILHERGIQYARLGASRYAAGLRQHIAGSDEEALVDVLIIGAYIEARSCERFAGLVPLLDEKLARFYRSLLKSERRHFEDYLALASLYSGGDIGARVAEFGALELELVVSPDDQFRFHSGVPAAAS
jgi:tRNA-(ms[2]io[6]A)-hydroxylase